MSNSLLGGRSAHVSPALMLLGEADRPETQCADCPAAVWYRQGELRAFCQVMKILSWTTGSDPVKVCDGRESAIARLDDEAAAASTTWR